MTGLVSAAVRAGDYVKGREVDGHEQGHRHHRGQ
jgi:hypothetical protein